MNEKQCFCLEVCPSFIHVSMEPKEANLTPAFPWIDWGQGNGTQVRFRDDGGTIKMPRKDAQRK